MNDLILCKATPTDDFMSSRSWNFCLKNVDFGRSEKSEFDFELQIDAQRRSDAGVIDEDLMLESVTFSDGSVCEIDKVATKVSESENFVLKFRLPVFKKQISNPEGHIQLNLSQRTFELLRDRFEPLSPSDVRLSIAYWVTISHRYYPFFNSFYGMTARS